MYWFFANICFLELSHKGVQMTQSSCALWPLSLNFWKSHTVLTSNVQLTVCLTIVDRKSFKWRHFWLLLRFQVISEIWRVSVALQRRDHLHLQYYAYIYAFSQKNNCLLCFVPFKSFIRPVCMCISYRHKFTTVDFTHIFWTVKCQLTLCCIHYIHSKCCNVSFI